MEIKSHQIRYIFLHFDGVILQNILAPITCSVIKKLGGTYSAEIENNIFAKSQTHAANFIINHLKLDISVQDVINLYYAERKLFEETHTIKFNIGVKKFLTLLKDLGYTVISYGGAPKEYFLNHVKDLSPFFSHDKYIQTREFRPGVKEIVFQMFGLKPMEALFIDEEFNIALAAKDLQVPFIGISTGYDYSFQKSEMKKLGVKYLIDSLEEMDAQFLTRIQKDVLDGCIWNER